MILGSATVTAIVSHILNMKRTRAETDNFRAQTESYVVNNALGLVESMSDELKTQKEEIRSLRDLLNTYIASEKDLTVEMNKLKAENKQLRIELDKLKNKTNG